MAIADLARCENQEKSNLGEAMKNCWIGYFLVLVMCIPALAQSQAGYQSGKIIKVTKLEDTSRGISGTDAQAKTEIHNYKVSVQIGDSVYVARYQSTDEDLASFAEGKDVQARVDGKVLRVRKANGKDAKGSIIQTTKATTP